MYIYMYMHFTYTDILTCIVYVYSVQNISRNIRTGPLHTCFVWLVVLISI